MQRVALLLPLAGCVGGYLTATEGLIGHQELLIGPIVDMLSCSNLQGCGWVLSD